MPFWNNFFLMAILVWIQTGFAMVILSAALRGIPEETIEAAVLVLEKEGVEKFEASWGELLDGVTAELGKVAAR